MLSATLEKLLNRGLPRSPRARQLCAALAGRSVAIVVPDIVRVRVTSTGQTLAVTQDDAPADAVISGGLLSLLALTGESAQTVIQRGEVSISGDSELAQSFRELAQLLRPDPEEELSLLIGDVPAHQLGRLARLGASLGARMVDTTLRNLGEYWAHERGDLVSRNEGEQFLRGVDALREGVDRLQARLDLLAQRRGAS
ncbi:MAG: SCP2 sterol-binding domain-containing protein [Gammaproteobacteria bacterium]|nr:SCP2 sterol-binding domain-containing protein [Gammaproteobacteria bacterium]MBV9724071.1 SCP2 sterol-binding domain-containing protein [Gammaproteobacteria bacterium]